MKDKTCLFVSLRVLIIITIISVFPLTAYSQDNVAEGKIIYEKYCIGCHGVKHDGKGTVAADLVIKPRDLTLGIFKFKSTELGSVPTDDDLKRTITHGLPPSSMPAFQFMPDAEKDALVVYIKTLSPKWKDKNTSIQYMRPNVPDFVGTPASIEAGKNLYAHNCAMCHGKDGIRLNVVFYLQRKGDKTPSDLTRPADFTYKTIKRGPKVDDIYLSITAGIEGTPMLSFSETLNDTDRWHLTSYVLSIMGKVRNIGGK